MKTPGRTALIRIAMGLALLAGGWGSSALAASNNTSKATKGADPVTLRFPMEDPLTSVKGVWATRFAQLVKQNTNGTVIIQIYPNSQLYSSPTDTIQATIGGQVDIEAASTGYLSQVIPGYAVVDLPLLFNNQTEVNKFEDGPVMQTLAKQALQKHLMVLNYISIGSAMPYTIKPAQTLASMKGLKMRVYNSILQLSMKALGASAISMPASELHTALQQHAIDGATLTLTFATSSKYWDVLHNATQVYVDSVVYPVAINTGTWAKLTASQQNAMMAAAAQATQENRAQLADVITQDTKVSEQNGIHFWTWSSQDMATARQDLQQVYAEEGKIIGQDIINQAEQYLQSIR